MPPGVTEVDWLGDRLLAATNRDLAAETAIDVGLVEARRPSCPTLTVARPRTPVVVLGALATLATVAGCGARSGLDPGERDGGAGGIDASARDAGVGRRDAGLRDAGGRDAIACAAPLERCGDEVPCCEAGSECVDPCRTGGLCSVPGRDGCGCLESLDECETPGTTCLFTPCDAPGVCVTHEEMRAICEAGAPPCFECPSCGDGLCAGPPPPVCDGPSRVRTYGEEWLGCDEGGECVYSFEARDCAPGERCAGGACVGGCGCPPGTVCCEPGLCGGDRPRCVPDPFPCLEPVSAIGCDGVTYGTICGAVEAGVCPNECDPVPSRTLPYEPCVEPVEGVRVVRDGTGFAETFTCSLPPPDFSTNNLVVVCYACACAARITFERIRMCADGAVVDYSYPDLCKECDACRGSCAVVETPILPPSVSDNFLLRRCGTECCTR